jgi:hypothetical protein
LNWEDWPPLSTQPYGVQADGTVVELFPPGLNWADINPADQLVTIAGVTPPPTPPVLTLGAGDPVTGGEVIPTAGWNLFIDQATGEPSLIDADGSTTVTPDNGEIYPISVT